MLGLATNWPLLSIRTAAAAGAQGGEERQGGEGGRQVRATAVCQRHSPRCNPAVAAVWGSCMHACTPRAAAVLLLRRRRLLPAAAAASAAAACCSCLPLLLLRAHRWQRLAAPRSCRRERTGGGVSPARASGGQAGRDGGWSAAPVSACALRRRAVAAGGSRPEGQNRAVPASQRPARARPVACLLRPLPIPSGVSPHPVWVSAPTKSNLMSSVNTCRPAICRVCSDNSST
jgi:hypothetical protein